jgi:hypothetical protein
MIDSAYISLNDSRFNYSYKGFCSIVCEIVSIALEHYSEFNNFDIVIDDPQTLLFYDCIAENCGKEYYDAGSWYLNRFFSNTRKYGEYNAHSIPNIDDLKLRNKILNNITT